MKNTVARFSEKLFRKISEKSRGSLIVSPMSVLYALVLIGGAASGETLDEIESLIGGKISEIAPELKKFSQKSDPFQKIFNSIWANGKMYTVSEDFAEYSRGIFSSDVMSVPFDNADTIRRINSWAADKTDGMITDAIDELDPSDVLLILNTVLFDGIWEDEYNENSIETDEFTSYEGHSRETDFMFSTERSYFETEGAIGFSKSYRGGYRFTAVLPDEDLCKFIESADFSSIISAADSARDEAQVSIPIFENENKLELHGTLLNLGLRRALSEDSELSKLGADGINVRIDKIIQKAKITVSEHGTRAAAVTEMSVALAMLRPDEKKTVYLNRPFLYFITDCDGVILFVGTVFDIGE